MEQRLVDLARSRGGLVTVPEASGLGISPVRLNRLYTAGLLEHVRRGAYVLADTWADADEPRRYALRTRAVLRTRRGVAASHHAALTLAGAAPWGVPLDRIDIVDVDGRATRVRGKAGLVLHPARRGARIVTDDLGDPRVDVPSALLGLARDVSALTFAVALEEALRCGLTSVAEVTAPLEREDQRRRWVLQAREHVTAADPLSASTGVTRLRILLAGMGFRPRLRVPLRPLDDGPVLRPDLLIGTSVAVSLTAYSRRELDRLRAAGVEVAQVTQSDLDHPHRVAAAIAGAMRELDLRRGTRARGA